jgi:uncharacterized protein
MSSGVKREPVRVSGRWLLLAIGAAILAAAFCAWSVLCLLFWQGSWQLLYHPTSSVSRTPASVGLPFESVAFAVTDEGRPRLRGWWVPAAQDAPFSRFTVLLLHGQSGNLGDTMEALARLHAVGVNVLAFDYRGYGQSQFVRPSESHWRQDAEWALNYLTATRHIDPHAIVICGSGLGADLAAEIAAAHPELAGAALEDPLANAVSAIFDDPRAHLLPAHLLAPDRWDLDVAARALRIPSLWILPPQGRTADAEAYRDVRAQKIAVWTNPGDRPSTDAWARWLDQLSTR